MDSVDEVLVIRLVLVAILFLVAGSVAWTLQRGLGVMRPGGSVRRREPSIVVVAPGETGLRPGAAFPVADGIVLGRARSNDIVLPDLSISARHAVLERTVRGWRIADLGSTNGTAVGGRPVDGRGVVLSGGEEIALGAVVLRFEA